jgi:hypothetical protein
MSTTKAYNELIDFIASGISTEQVAAFQPSEETRARFRELVDAKKQGLLTSEESAELETYLQIEHIMRMAKARAHQILFSQP